MSKIYNFTQYIPKRRFHTPNVVSMHPSGKISFNNATLTGFKKTTLPEYAAIYFDSEQKQIGVRFFTKSETIGKFNLFKIVNEANRVRFSISATHIYDAIGVERPNKAVKVKITKTDNDIMVIDLSHMGKNK